MSSADADGVLVLALRAADVPIASDDLASLVDDGVAFAKLIRSALVRIDSVAFKHLAETLPSEDDDSNVAERFRVAGAYAEALRTIGYGGDGGNWISTVLVSERGERAVDFEIRSR